jgi:hypothetical protein
VAAGLAGCNSERQQPAEIKNLQLLASMYGRYTAMNKGKPPPDEASLRKFIAGLSADELAGLGLDSGNLDKLFVSPRDGQPYVVRYKTSASLPGPDGTVPVIAYEQIGKGGKRLVARGTSQVEEIDEQKLRQLVPDAK